LQNAEETSLSEDEIDEFQVDRRVGFEPGSRKVPVSLSLTEPQSSPWPGVATGDPRAVGRPPDWRRTSESHDGREPVTGARRIAKQYLMDLPSAAPKRLADRCPTCSADLELRDRTYGINLVTCLFCQTERPRQVDVSSGNTPKAWAPPARVLTSKPLSPKIPAQRPS